MKTPLISVIIPTYNRSEMLSDALESLIHQENSGDFSYEIIVVDNASTDSTKTVVEQAAAKAPVPVRYVQTKYDDCYRRALVWYAGACDDLTTRTGRRRRTGPIGFRAVGK